jgi:hypothetical protein
MRILDECQDITELMMKFSVIIHVGCSLMIFFIKTGDQLNENKGKLTK